MKKCKHCGGNVFGRSDKIFCSYKCRNIYNNRFNYIKNLLHITKKRSEKLNIPFNIDESDLIVPKFCPLLDIPIFIKEGSLTNNSPSLDKIIPELGYIKGNVWIISMRANRMKSDLSKKEMIMFCKRLLEKIN